MGRREDAHERRGGVAVRSAHSSPMIGFLYTRSPEPTADRLRAFHRGLKQNDDVEGENVNDCRAA